LACAEGREESGGSGNEDAEERGECGGRWGGVDEEVKWKGKDNVVVLETEVSGDAND